VCFLWADLLGQLWLKAEWKNPVFDSGIYSDVTATPVRGSSQLDNPPVMDPKVLLGRN